MEEKKQEEKTKETEPIEEQIVEQVKESLKKIADEKVQQNNVDYLYRLTDIYKDFTEIKKMKGENNMRYSDYEGDYSYGARGVPGTGRGRYSDGAYGRRGVPGTGRGRYRGEEDMEEMKYHYGNYSNSKEMYGNDQETMESFKYMLKSMKDFYKHLKQEANSSEEVRMLQKTVQEMAEM